MACTLRMRTVISPERWQPWTGYASSAWHSQAEEFSVILRFGLRSHKTQNLVIFRCLFYRQLAHVVWRGPFVISGTCLCPEGLSSDLEYAK